MGSTVLLLAALVAQPVPRDYVCEAVQVRGAPAEMDVRVLAFSGDVLHVGLREGLASIREGEWIPDARFEGKKIEVYRFARLVDGTLGIATSHGVFLKSKDDRLWELGGYFDDVPQIPADIAALPKGGLVASDGMRVVRYDGQIQLLTSHFYAGFVAVTDDGAVFGNL